MTDRELLELAAKAAGIVGVWARTHQPYGDTWVEGIDCGGPVYWNPLAEDGDALRLAVKMGICIEPYPIYRPGKHSVIAKQRRPSDTLRVPNTTECLVPYEDDPYAATRRAITRAAAEIGKAMP